MMTRKRKTKYEPPDPVTVLGCQCCSFETEDVKELDDHIHSNSKGEEDTMNLNETAKAESQSKEEEEIQIVNCEKPDKKKFKGDNVEQYYKCSLCEYNSLDKDEVAEHLSVHDSDAKSGSRNVYKHSSEIYKCSHCPYQTKRKTDMPKHLLVHCSNATLYKCSECPYQTKRKNDLPKHILCHRAPETVPIYPCTYLGCEYFTKRKGDLSKHLLNHQEKDTLVMFDCTECPYKTKRMNDLYKHMLVHCDRHITGIFKCLKCDYATDKVHKFSKHVLGNCLPWDDSINMEHLVLEEVLDNVDKEGTHVLLEMEDDPDYVEYGEFVEVADCDVNLETGEEVYEIYEVEDNNTDGSIQCQPKEKDTGVFNSNLGEFAVATDHDYQEH